jgi:hypothetical protein
MDQRARMFRVLASLVVAMTITAGLLILIEPSQSTAQVLVPQLAAEQAQRVVSRDLRVGLGRWHQIDVAPCPPPTGARSMALAAITATDQFHFVITATGLVHATGSWLGQQAIGQPSDVVRIGVACDGTEENLSLGQRAALEALLRELHTLLSTTAGWRSVSVQSAPLAETLNRSLARTLKAILAEIGSAA